MGHVRATDDKAKTHREQVERLNAEVEALKRQLRRTQRLAAVGTMTAMVAHEFNNILTPVINYARLARSNPALQAKAIDHAASGGQRAADICQAILGMTRDDPPHPVQAPVARIVSDSIAAMARAPRKDGIELVLNVPEKLTVKTRPIELQQVIVNLMMNAREAMLAAQGARRLEVSAGKAKGGVTISVRDTGVGIPPENLERIFEPFFTTGGGSNGHGLGLAISKDIIESMGGRIAVESAPGRGSTFTIFLPA